jgi:tetratricopeptide (TPR) repeat protein
MLLKQTRNSFKLLIEKINYQKGCISVQILSLFLYLNFIHTIKNAVYTMKIFLTTLLFLTGLPLICSSKTYVDDMPKDSTSGIIDKAACLIKLEEGRKLFDERRYRDALVVFREAAQKDPYNWKASYWIASSHYAVKNYGYAKKYAEETLIKGGKDSDPEVFEILGGSNHNLGNLDTAQIYYERAKQYLPSKRMKELEIEHRISQIAYAKTQKGIENLRFRMGGDFNSGYNDYSPVVSADGKTMYFTSRRGNTTGGLLNPDDQEYFEDIYRAKWNASENKWDSISNNIERLNTSGFDNLGWISADGLNAVLVMNNTAVEGIKKKNLTKSSDICEAQFTNKGKWTIAKPIKNKTINTTFFEGAPSLTSDGNTMYFVSDRKANKTSTDLYMATKTGKTWGNAVLLPKTINTEYGENTPFVSPDGRFLFFASEGHEGMGGYDLFVAENLGNNTWSDPINLGAQINSVNNESHFTFSKSTGKIYFASYVISGQKGNIDLFEINLSSFKMPVKI